MMQLAAMVMRRSTKKACRSQSKRTRAEPFDCSTWAGKRQDVVAWTPSKKAMPRNIKVLVVGSDLWHIKRNCWRRQNWWEFEEVSAAKPYPKQDVPSRTYARGRPYLTR